jgi:hypothetical protein
MRRLVVGWVALGLVALAIVVACDAAGTETYDGPRSPCSTGDPQPGSLPQADPNEDLDKSRRSRRHGVVGAEPQDFRGLPECIPRCAESRRNVPYYGSVFTVAALPSGACFENEACTMATVWERVCSPTLSTFCSLTGYVCRCQNERWRCWSGPQGASACLCPTAEAGIPDDASDGSAQEADADATRQNR